jgi:Tol biopolymer transport system component
MILPAGTRLGPYEVLAPIGAGGMGEVYRAHDPRLGRDVAIKVLPSHLSTSPELRSRFEREARAISRLNHPHICTLHDIGHHGDTDYLVMELLEGETLAHRLEKGPLPLSDVLRYGVEIAGALDVAHRGGIVHRDLKPGNVMLTKAGAKLMDFGLARATGLPVAAAGLTESPTMSRPLTAEGAIVGTLQYMAPEQLEGREADPRSDLWALGCVLYEMATGKRAFAGASQASLIAAVLKESPAPMTELQPLTPPALERIVTRCLEKEPDERWRSAGDLAFDLEGLATSATGGAHVVVPGASRRAPTRLRERLAWSAAGVAALVAIGALVAPRLLRQVPEPQLMRFAVAGPAGVTVLTDATSAAISPDGRRLAFVGVDGAGSVRLYVRALEDLSVQPLAGTENAVMPFWSPDSRFVGFFAEGKLRKVAVSGGSPEVISDAPYGRGGSWNRDGVIVFAPSTLGPVLKVSANGGAAVQVARPDAARGETGLRFPCFLPDGRHFLYVALPRKGDSFDVYAGTLDGREPIRVMSAGSAPIYAEPGYLIFAAGDRLVAQRFDADRLQPVGDETLLGVAAPASGTEGAALLSASANGVLVTTATTPRDTRLVWLDRTGRPLGTVPIPPGSYGSPALSPDDRRAIVTKASSPTSYDLWMVDLQRAVTTRLTFDGSVESGGGIGVAAVWSPDGRQAAFECDRSGIADIYGVLASGAGQPEPLVQSSVIFKSPVAWTPDGKYLVFAQLVKGSQYDLWLMPLEGDRKPVPHLRTPFNESLAAISPDGRWLAYDSDETGTQEIYVRSFSEPGEKYRISSSGGSGLQWSRDGRELIYWVAGQFYSAYGPVYSVEVETAPTFRAGQPRLLFTARPDLTGLTATSDLSRFLAVVPAEGADPPSLTVTLDWQMALEH